MATFMARTGITIDRSPAALGGAVSVACVHP